MPENTAVAVHGSVLDPPAISVEPELEQARLHTALQTRDADVALPILMHRHGATVYRYCRRMLGNDDDGNDVSQTVFLQAFEAIQGGARIDSVRSWLVGIARHRCLDQLARYRRGPLLVEADELDRAADRHDPPEAEMIDRSGFRALEDCIDALDQRSRTVLLLRFHDDLSYEAISEVTGDSPGALRVRVARALPALRRCLELKGVTL